MHILFKSLANWIDRLEAKPHIWIWHRRLCLFKLIAAAAAPLWLCTRSQVLLPAQWLGHRCSCSRTQRIYSWWLRVCDCRGKMRAPACHGWPPYNNSYMRWLPVRRCRRCGINKNTKPVRLSASVCFLLLLLSFAIWLELGARERMNCWLVDICTSAHNVFAFSSASFDGDMMLDYNSPSRAQTQKQQQQQHQAPQSRRWAHSVNRRSRIIIKHRHAPSSAAMCNGNRHGNASDTQLYVAFTCEVWPCDSCRSCHCEYHSHCESITAQTIESSVDLRRCRCCRRHHRHRRRSRSHSNVIWMEHQYY